MSWKAERSSTAGLVLNAGMSDNATKRSPAGSLAQCFAHLVNESVPDHLEAATCVYFDGIAPDFSITGMLDVIESWFSRQESKPKVVLVGSSDKKKPRQTVKSMRVAASANDAAFRRSFNTLQFFPKGRTTIDDTWRPSVYFAVAAERPSSAFFCVNEVLDTHELWALLQQGHQLFRSCASYAFWFPERFSPLGYYWGIGVEPAGRRHGVWGKRESRRLSHWRDNTSIGIANDGERRFFAACDGYVRDAYPLMLLSERHMRRRVGGSTLLERIAKDNFGEVEAVGNTYLWRIPPEKLAAAQKLLDDSDISQSGRRLEDVSSVWDGAEGGRDQ